MFAEDLGQFFNDFGVVAELGALTATVLLDAPDANILGDRVQTTNYAMTFIGSDFPALKHGDWLTIDGNAYTVQTVSSLEDGAIKSAALERVTA